MTRATSTPHRTACTVGLAVTLAVCALMAAHGTLAVEFGGSPIISYGQRFKIFSVALDLFCRTDCAQKDCAVFCDVHVSNATQATYFVLGGSCGRVVPSNLTMASLYAFDGGSCASGMGSISNPNGFRCANPQCGPTAARFNIINDLPPSDGWLRGNDTIIHMRDALSDSTSNWCTALAPPGGLWCGLWAPYGGFKFVIDE
ncbi:hypothetical protein pdul_cds_542 [Pandoravirus dulcis]|uniref:Uncharacterized protein n=1 Tax=Pandoravirus dulcis TaxID=1349409 RepID=S4VXN2_9VIRU|nr:hypothetical protein pdul_cds_542 [Pandoravirus dulcis]AGO82649.1 hypothetical protein pdul_cds_542 [Pandoravirus dulcis]